MRIVKQPCYAHIQFANEGVRKSYGVQCLYTVIDVIDTRLYHTMGRPQLYNVLDNYLGTRLYDLQY